jgi:hypothetical protein
MRLPHILKNHKKALVQETVSMPDIAWVWPSHSQRNNAWIWETESLAF